MSESPGCQAGGLCVSPLPSLPRLSLFRLASPHLGLWRVLCLVMNWVPLTCSCSHSLCSGSKSCNLQREIGVKIQLEFDRNKFRPGVWESLWRIARRRHLAVGDFSWMLLGDSPPCCLLGNSLPRCLLGHIPAWPLGKGSDQTGARRSELLLNL